ncbi:hypothetical protein M2404_002112 [Rheinheimera pacifica]|nr:hypothetical protein [Rheinheimera pacifica]
MLTFKGKTLIAEDAFWVILKVHYDLSGGAFDVSDILTALELIGKHVLWPPDSQQVASLCDDSYAHNN